MNLKEIGPTGTTTTRKAFWDSARYSVLALQKLKGKNVSVNEYQGKGTVINIIRKGEEPTTGACCIDGVCSIVTESACNDAGGNYLGNGSTCDGVDCTQGACCDAGVCTITTADGCTGVYQGDGTTCEGVTCPPAGSGACCHIDGTCTIETLETCDGAFQGEDTTCEAIDCTHTGACCVGGVCSITRAADCVGDYQGDGTDCDPNPCPMDSCDCMSPFAPFDGSPGYYRTLTQEVSGTYDNVDPPAFTIHIEYSSTRVADCSGVCECTGSGLSTCAGTDCSGPGCTAVTAGCGIGYLDSCLWNDEGGGCGPPVTQGIILSDVPPDSESWTATVRTSTWSHTTGTITVSATRVETLSNPCTP